MNTGYLLLVHYKFDPVAFVVRLVTRSHWNHVALILDDKKLIEANGRGIVINPISKFSKTALYETKIIKLRDIDPINLIVALRLAEGAKQRYKWGYLRLILTYFAILLGFRGFRLTCSGFLAVCLDMVYWRFREDKEPFQITPGDIARSDKVEEVI